jgi:hypothetical protein
MTDHYKTIEDALTEFSEYGAYSADKAEPALAALRELQTEPEVIAWEATTPAYIKHVTDKQYRAFSETAKRWYKPYKCSNCELKADVGIPITSQADHPDVRELRKWLNEGQTGEIDRRALARVLAMFSQQPDILAQWDAVQGKREGGGRQWHSVGAWLCPGDAIAVISDSSQQVGINGLTQAETDATMSVRGLSSQAQTPYANCRFQICDLPGQCKGEGKCHHPAVQPAQAASAQHYPPSSATPEMIAAAEQVEDLYRRGTPDTWGKVWRAMLAAAPVQVASAQKPYKWLITEAREYGKKYQVAYPQRYFKDDVTLAELEEIYGAGCVEPVYTAPSLELVHQARDALAMGDTVFYPATKIAIANLDAWLEAQK